MVPLLIAVPIGAMLAWKRGDLAGVLGRLKAALAITAAALLVQLVADAGHGRARRAWRWRSRSGWSPARWSSWPSRVQLLAGAAVRAAGSARRACRAPPTP